MGEFTLKGISRPLAAYNVLAEKAQTRARAMIDVCVWPIAPFRYRAAIRSLSDEADIGPDFMSTRPPARPLPVRMRLFPDPSPNIPCFVEQGISRQAIETSQRLGDQVTLQEPKFEEFTDNFPVSKELDGGDRFECDCVRHHQIKSMAQQGLQRHERRAASAAGWASARRVRA